MRETTEMSPVPIYSNDEECMSLVASWFYAGLLLGLNFDLKMEATCSCEIDFQLTTQRHIPEDGILCRAELLSQTSRDCYISVLTFRRVTSQ
jgi:hypothetical protein